ncbi:uncharacterized protein LOC122083223 [Macadamia integrifolia]|uniref:uncharacterized protein LOC122083223 n=1 Tax=Macadamia integrifolia TaxID=60698 RepID=UPI001C4E2FB1|nr:uncharacterized protein LOC122083223 [Macadamia integrifolia]
MAEQVGRKLEGAEAGEEEKKRSQKASDGEEEKKEKVLEGLPLESSPYVKYSDLEDYKRKGYGTEGHLEPKPGRGAGATDAPTLSGGAVAQLQGLPDNQSR